MKKGGILCLLLAVFCSYASLNAQSLNWSHNPNVLYDHPESTLRSSGTEVNLRWEFVDEPGMWDTVAPKLKELDKYRKTVRKVLTDAVVNVQLHQMTAKDTAIPASGPVPGQSPAAEVRPLSALESHFMCYQGLRFPLYEHPSQFQCFILKKDTMGMTMVRMYFVSSDAAVAPSSKLVFKLLDADMKDRWKMYAFMENHPSNGNTAIASLEPEGPEMARFIDWRGRYGLQHIFITNGFRTKDIDAATLAVATEVK